MQCGILTFQSKSSGVSLRGKGSSTGVRSEGPCVAVTGGIACGKSAFGRLLAERGAEVADADEVVHRMQSPGGPVSQAVAREFGAGFLDPEGAVDRKRLGALVFADPVARKRLEQVSHPLVRGWFGEWRAKPAVGWAKVALIPLLFESGWESDWDVTVCVGCPPEVQMARLRERGLDEVEARRRIEAQWPLPEKIKHADIVVHNGAGWDVLAEAADHLKRWFLEKSNP